MIRFSRILFPVDLSEPTRETAPFVTAMAARFNSEVIVLHVLGSRLSYYPLPAAATPVALKRDQEKRERRQKEFESFVAPRRRSFGTTAIIGRRCGRMYRV
jgi:hypothetical protein